MERVKSEGRICCYPPRFDQGSYDSRCFSGETEFKERKKKPFRLTQPSLQPQSRDILRLVGDTLMLVYFFLIIFVLSRTNRYNYQSI